MISKTIGKCVRKEWEKTRKKHKSRFPRKSGFKKGNSLQFLMEKISWLFTGPWEISRFWWNIFQFLSLFTTSHLGFKYAFRGLRTGKVTLCNKTVFPLIYLEAFGWLMKIQTFGFSLTRFIRNTTNLLPYYTSSIHYMLIMQSFSAAQNV